MSSTPASAGANGTGRSPTCRVCLSGINCTHNIFVAKCSDGVTLAAALVACARVQISIDDGLPSVVCDKCANDVETFVRLRKRCTESNVVLRRQLQKRPPDGNGERSDEAPATDTLFIKTEIGDESHDDDAAKKDDAFYPTRDDDDRSGERVIAAIDLKVYEAILDSAAKQSARTSRTCPGAALRSAAGAKPFECELCRKSFTNRSNLLRHVRSHSGERPYECDVCFKSFTLKHHLYEHLRIHSGDRPFKCRVCGKAFSRKSHLLRHSRTHHADRFVCRPAAGADEKCGQAREPADDVPAASWTLVK